MSPIPRLAARAAVPALLLFQYSASGLAQSRPPKESPAPGRLRAAAAGKALADFSGAIEELAAGVGPAVVQIEVRARTVIQGGEGRNAGYLAEQHATGSGALVDEAGYIITNAHVVANARSISVSVMNGGATAARKAHRHYAGKLIGIDKETDLAVVKIDAPEKLPTLEFEDSDKLRQGQVVLALGSPLGLDNTLTVGYVSAPMRQLDPDKPMTYIQTDAPINPGNSGGPLLDIAGRIVGLNTLILSQSGGSEGIGFAIPSNTIRAVYSQLREEGHVHRGAIGVLTQEITPELAAGLGLKDQSGLIIADVVPEGPAAAAGLETGDILLSVDGNPLDDPSELAASVFRHKAGDEIQIELLRRDERLRKAVSVLERPNSPGSLADLASYGKNLVKQLGVLAITLDEKVNAILPGLRRLSGVVVAAVPAEYAGIDPGLRGGDVIYSINGQPVSKLEELRQILDSKKAGDAVALLVERDGQLSYLAFDLE